MPVHCYLKKMLIKYFLGKDTGIFLSHSITGEIFFIKILASL